MVLFYTPRDSREAAELLRACTNLKAEGRRVSVGVLESPFKPAAWLSEVELGSSDVAPESVSPSDEIEVNFKTGQVRNLTTGREFKFDPLPEFLLEIIEAGGGIAHLKKRLGI